MESGYFCNFDRGPVKISYSCKIVREIQWKKFRISQKILQPSKKSVWSQEILWYTTSANQKNRVNTHCCSRKCQRPEMYTVTFLAGMWYDQNFNRTFATWCNYWIYYFYSFWMILFTCFHFRISLDRIYVVTVDCGLLKRMNIIK